MKIKFFYVTDEKQQAQYIKMFKDNDMEAVMMNTVIDTHFIQFLEMNESGVKFLRIDSDLSESMKDKETSSDENSQKEISENLEKLFKENLNNDKLKIKVEALKTATLPGMILMSEQARRIQEMSRMYGGFNFGGMYAEEETLVLNSNNGLIKSLLSLKDKEDRKEDVKLICEHIYDLAKMSHKQLEPDDMTRFIERSNSLLSKLASGQ